MNLTKVTLLILSFTSISAGAQTNLAAWAEKIQVKGDIRFRHDYNSQADADDTSESHKERIRLRLGFYSQVNEKTKLNIRLATAESGNATSTNQTMTNNNDKKSVYFDLANIDWAVTDSTRLLLGKMENPLRVVNQSQLIYDVDYTPEGLGIHNKFGGLFVNLGAFSIQERAPQSTTSGTSEPDSGLLGAVAGYKSESEGLSWMITGGYHTFTALKKNAALSTGFLGNSNTGARYIHDYQVAELGGEVKFNLGSSAVAIFADVIKNLYVDEEGEGVLAGAQFQTLDSDKKPLWSFTYAYMGLDKDATVSAINNSDWGNGNDGGFGHMGQVGYVFTPNTNATLTWMHMNVDANGAPFGTERVLADLQVTF